MPIQQAKFSQYLRKNEAPLSSLQTEKIYYHLLRANLQELFFNIYPRLKGHLGEESWQFLLDQFLIHHKARTPYFYQVPDEFLSFLWHNKAQYSQWPWLWSLAHFEWMELVASVADEAWPESDPTRPRCSPLAYYCQYEYAVYPEDGDYTPLSLRERPWQGIVYRNKAHEVQWFACEPWSALIFTALQQAENKNSGDVVSYLQKQVSHESTDTIRQSLMAWCDEWRKLDILV